MEVPEHVTATIIGEDGVERDVTVKDLSAGGAWLIVDDSFENDDFVELPMEGYGKFWPGSLGNSSKASASSLSSTNQKKTTWKRN